MLKERKKSSTVDTFVRFLQKSFAQSDYSVSEVHKSGSLGKGTAVKDSADIDLVVFFNGLGKMKNLRQCRDILLDHLEEQVSNYRPWRRRVNLVQRTNYSLSYTLDGQQLDIVPAFDVLKSVQDNPSVIYNNMAQYPQGWIAAAHQYSASLAPIQVAFVKPVSDNVKRVIRLVKYWKTENELNIRSYTVELVTIHAAKTTMAGTTDDLFKSVMWLLKRCTKLRIAFDDNYDSEDYTQSLRPPYVLDPANPFMNTLHGTDTAEVKREARRTFRLL